MAKTTILALDGGGGKALRTLQTLKYVEARTRNPCRELFDRIAGTSTGGILALGLTSGMSAMDLESFYVRKLPVIFDRAAWWNVKNLWGAAGPKYDAGNLRACLTEVFGDAPIPKQAVVITVDMTTGDAVELTGATLRTDLQPWHAVDAALATSAAPTFFAPHETDGRIFWDGGLILNNGALAALDDIAPPAEALILSVGTGMAKSGYPVKTVRNWKPLECIPAVLGEAMDGVSRQTHKTLRAIVPPGQYVRVQSEFANDKMDVSSPAEMGQLIADGQRMLAEHKAELDAFIDLLMKS